MSDTEDNAVSAFVTSLVINVAIGGVAMGIYSYMRSKPGLSWCYFPRIVRDFPDPTNRTKPVDGPKQSLWEWLVEAWNAKEEDLVPTLGLDAVMMTRFFKLGIRFFTVASLVGLVILIPINVAEGTEDASDFNQLTMASLESASNFYWFHLLAAYGVFGYMCYLLRAEYQAYVKLRHQFHLAELTPQCLTVLVRDIPEQYRTSEALKAHFDKLYPDQVGVCFVARSSEELQAHCEERIAYFHKLERALMDKADGKTPMVRPTFCGTKEDALEFYQAEIERLNDTIHEMQNDEAQFMSSGFVSFNSMSSRYSALTRFQSQTPRELTVDQAPSSFEVHWPNMNLGYEERSTRSNFVMIATWALVAFYLIPIAFVSSLTTLSNLASTFPFLEPILDSNDVVKGLLEGFLPTLALTIFMALLPVILLAMSKVEGLISLSSLELGVCSKFFKFQYFNFFLASVLAGSFLAEAERIIESPTDIVSILSNTLPGFSTFFINYIMLVTFAAWPLQLVRAAPLLVGSLKKKYLCKTEFEFQQAELPGPYKFGTAYPMHLLIFIIGLVYTIIAPLILPFALSFFALGWAVTTYQLTYVFHPQYEGGGAMYPFVLNRIFLGMETAQLTLIGYFGLREAAGQSTLMIPLFVMTVLLQRNLQSTYDERANQLSQDEIVAFDANDGDRVDVSEAYLRRCFKEGPINITELVPAREESA